MNYRQRRKWLLQFSNYKEYLKSNWWKKRKMQFWLNHERRCFCCEGSATEIHHNSYERKGAEKDKDLVALCHYCHETISKLVAEGKLKLLTAHIDFKTIYRLRISDKDNFEYLQPIYKKQNKLNWKWEQRLQKYQQEEKKEIGVQIPVLGRTKIRLGSH